MCLVAAEQFVPAMREGENEVLLDGASNHNVMDTSNTDATLGKKSPLTVSPRLKAYPPDFGGPYVVFFRPKGKRLNISQISKDLEKRYSSVTTIDMVGSGKLRVTVGDRKQANEIVASELFTLEYKVYIPSAAVEVSGVVTEGSMTIEELKQGSGRFKNVSLPPVEILECKQMYSVSQEGDKRVYKTSDSFCVTFTGSALPDYVVIGKLRLPVRLYVPKVMNCVNCSAGNWPTPLSIAAINLAVFHAERGMWMARARRRRNVFIVTALLTPSKPAQRTCSGEYTRNGLFSNVLVEVMPKC